MLKKHWAKPDSLLVLDCNFSTEDLPPSMSELIKTNSVVPAKNIAAKIGQYCSDLVLVFKITTPFRGSFLRCKSQDKK